MVVLNDTFPASFSQLGTVILLYVGSGPGADVKQIFEYHSYATLKYNTLIGLIYSCDFEQRTRVLYFIVAQQGTLL